MAELLESSQCIVAQRCRTQLVVLPIDRGWTILVNGEANGRFETQDAALCCIRSILGLPWLRHSIAELLVSTPAGEVIRVPAS